MRTICRVSLRLNENKWNALVEMARRYAQEKNDHLQRLASDAHFAAIGRPGIGWRVERDSLLRAGYTSPHGLQGRMWKMALKDAYETIDRQWAALAHSLRPRVTRQEKWSEAQRHYAFWLLKIPTRLAQLCAGRAPVPAHFEIGGDEQRQVRNHLRRVARRARGCRPRARQARSLALDAEMYDVFEEGGRHAQRIKVMSLAPRQRIVIPLTGNTPICGNIRLVLDYEQQRVEVHYTVKVKTARPLTGEPCGLDAGVSEVFTDDSGQRYGAGFGAALERASEKLNDKGKKRNKLHQLAKKAAARGDRRKARNIHRYNLGRKKLNRTRRKARAELARQINTAINQVLKQRQPSAVVTERLDIRGKARSRRLSRVVSLWTRSILNERVEFKASAGREAPVETPKAVNPAYSSQMCPACGFVHRDNRHGDAFQCLHCQHADDADRVAAHNLKARLADDEIRPWTPAPVVRNILLARFNARLESSLIANGDSDSESR